MTDVLNVTIRDEKGSGACKKIRAQGLVPAVLYGHGEANVVLSVQADELDSAIRHGSQMVDLAGGLGESALISEVQWDAFGSRVLHIDLTRVSASEIVQVTVSVELRGEAPGVNEGGVVEHLMHSLELKCPAGSIPDKIEASINTLSLGDTIRVADLELPEGATAIAAADVIAVQCVEPTEIIDEDDIAGTNEPEIIGRQAEDEEND